MTKISRKAVAYFRYSSDNQTENSIHYQRMTAKAYCIKNNIDIVKEYVDEAYTATTDHRPNFLRLLEDAKNKPDWDIVLVYDYSRFVRNISDAVIYTNVLEDHDIELISITQEFGKGNEAYLLKYLTHLMNDFYSKNNSKHTHSGLKSKAMQGVHCGGRPPLGYNLDDTKHLIINEAEAKIVELIFNMYELGYSYTKMADVLNSRGYRNKLGEPFSKFSFDSILRQEKYVGTYIWNKVKAKNSKHQRNSHKYKPLEEQVVIEDGCPAIISKEQFNRVQQKLNSKNFNAKKSMHYMLSGLKILKCKECGSYMTGLKRTTHGRVYTTYYCPNHKNNSCSMKEIATIDLDNLVAEELAYTLCNRTDLDEISAYLNNSSEYVSAKNKIKGNKKATSNILKAIGTYYSPELVEELRNLSRQKKELEQVLSEYENSAKTINEDNVKEVAENLKKCLIESDMPEVKMYLKEHIDEILVGADDITITLDVA